MADGGAWMLSRKSTKWSCLACSPVVAGLILLTGCQFTWTRDPSVSNLLATATLPYNMLKLGSTHYQEQCTISTEPPGCRVYVGNKYVGDAPVTIMLDGGTFELWSMAGGRRWYTEGAKSDRMTWEVAAFKDGFEIAKTTITAGDEIGDAVFDKAFKGLKDGLLTSLPESPERVVGERFVLLQLRSASSGPLAQAAVEVKDVVPSANGGTRSNQMQPVNTAAMTARAEYEQAMAAYKQALESRNLARLSGNSLTLAKNQPNVTDKSNKVLDIAGLGQQWSVDNSEKDIALARERLKWAKARLHATGQ